MSGLPEGALIWGAKAGGAVAGSAISIAFMLPVNRREAALRFAVGVVCGLVFGGMAGLKLAVETGLEGKVGAPELMLAGSAVASLSAWWALGVLAKIARQRADKY